MSPHHDCWTEERLLETALTGEESASDRLDRQGCPECSDRFGEIEAFLAGCRATLLATDAAPLGSAEAARLGERVLARTTREDLGWRGELHLLRGFFAARWRASVPVRVVAASLLLHLLSLPLLAYFGFFETQPAGFRTGIEWRETLPPEDPEPEYALESAGEPEALPEVLEVPVPGTVDGVDVLNALQWARYHLGRGAPQPDAAGPPTSDVTAVLGVRGESIRGTAGPSASARAVEWSRAGGAVVQALACELLLDRYVLERRVPRGLSEALAPLGRAEDDGALLLQTAALARAEAYGLLEPDERRRLATARARLARSPLAARAAVLTGAALRPGAPIDRVWIEALEVAAGDVLAADAVGRAWRGWGE